MTGSALRDVLGPAAREGLRLCLPVAISVAAYGLVWGVLAGQAGMSLAEVAAMSAFVFAGAAQFVALELWAPVPPVWSLIAATLAVNLRFVLMTATLRPVFGRLPKGAALWRMHLIADENWAVGMAEMARGRDGAAAMVAGGLLLFVTWLAATAAGRALGTGLDDPARWGLDFAFVAVFLALLVSLWRGLGDLLPWLVAGAVAVAASLLVPGKWYIVLGGLAGSLAGAWQSTRAGSARRDAA